MIVIDCPAHPGQPMLAIQQTSFTSPCTLQLVDGVIEVEMDPMSEFVRDMESTVVLCYMCSTDGCSFTIQPDELGNYAQHAMHLVRMFFEELEEESESRAQWEQDVAEKVVAPQQGWPECVQEPGEDNEDYTKRKARYMQDMLAQHRTKVEARTEKQDPIESFRKVFGGGG